MKNLAMARVKKGGTKPPKVMLTANQKKFLSCDLGIFKIRTDEFEWKRLIEKIALRLSDNQLARILGIPNFNLEALCWKFEQQWAVGVESAGAEAEGVEFPVAMYQHFQGLAAALEQGQKEYSGRLIKWWVEVPRYNSMGMPFWTKRYMETVEADAQFQLEYKDLQKCWPSELMFFNNYALPNWPRSIVNTRSIGRHIDEAVSRQSILENKPYQCSEAFLRKARRFVRRWSIDSIALADDGFHWYPSRIQCASEVFGQGTYVFIPRYYKWSDQRNYEDFKSAITMVNETHARFESLNKVKGRVERSMIAYVNQRLGNRPPTEKLVFQFVDEWLAQQKYSSKRNQRTTYRNAARRAFNFLPATVPRR